MDRVIDRADQSSPPKGNGPTRGGNIRRPWRVDIMPRHDGMPAVFWRRRKMANRDPEKQPGQQQQQQPDKDRDRQQQPQQGGKERKQGEQPRRDQQEKAEERRGGKAWVNKRK